MEQVMLDASKTKDSINVAAVVVTFNRLEKLKTVLESLQSQTRVPDQLIIVNNASTDGTAKYLEEFARDFSMKDRINLNVVTLPEKVGGAGGFSAGMRKGYELGADFVWIFDDDGYPQPKALENLLNGFNSAVDQLGPDVPYACSMVKFVDGSICEMNNPVPTWDWGRLIAKGFNNLVMVTSCSFVSVLIPRWVMEKYGLPFKEYFIWFDDAEYTLRITRVGPGVQVLDSVIVHDMGANKGVNFTMIDQKNAWKFAYGVRNQASYRLHHEGKAKYLLFCANVIRQMRRGRVERNLKIRMIKQMLKAISFNPKVDFPQNKQAN